MKKSVFELVTNATIVVELPKESMDILDDEEMNKGYIADQSYCHFTWNHMATVIDRLKSNELPDWTCAVDDKSTGFDIHSVTFELWNWETLRQFERTVEWLNRETHKEYNRLRAKYEKQAV